MINLKINELYPDVITEDLHYELKSILSSDNPLKWAKTIVGYANGDGGIIFVGVSNNRDVFGLSIEEIDKTKNLIAIINDRHIFPHAKISYSMRSVDNDAEKFVLAVKIYSSDSVVRYRDGDFNETVYIKGDGNTTPATPEDIISLSKRKYGVDNSISEILYKESDWSKYLSTCSIYRTDHSIPSLKELQNEQIVSKDGYSSTGLLMFKDDYANDDSLICCRLWKGINKVGTVLDTGRYKGPLLDVFSSTLNFLERNTKSGWKKAANGGREEVRSYPKEAIREILVNAIAHRDYSIMGTQIDVDIYDDRIEVVSPGSWLLPKPYEEYPVGTIPSIRRNTIIAACLDVANLMERGGTGFQTIVECYKKAPENKQPVVSAYPGFLSLKLYDLLYNEEVKELDVDNITDLKNYEEVIIHLLKSGPKQINELQGVTPYKSRSTFLSRVINPLIEKNIIKREGNPKSPYSVFILVDDKKNL